MLQTGNRKSNRRRVEGEKSNKQKKPTRQGLRSPKPLVSASEATRGPHPRTPALSAGVAAWPGSVGKSGEWPQPPTSVVRPLSHPVPFSELEVPGQPCLSMVARRPLRCWCTLGAGASCHNGQEVGRKQLRLWAPWQPVCQSWALRSLALVAET